MHLGHSMAKLPRGQPAPQAFDFLEALLQGLAGDFSFKVLLRVLQSRAAHRLTLRGIGEQSGQVRCEGLRITLIAKQTDHSIDHYLRHAWNDARQ